MSSEKGVICPIPGPSKTSGSKADIEGIMTEHFCMELSSINDVITKHLSYHLFDMYSGISRTIEQLRGSISKYLRASKFQIYVLHKNLDYVL